MSVIMSEHALDPVVNRLLSSYDSLGGFNHIDGETLPSRQAIEDIISLIQDLLFPGYFSTFEVTHDQVEGLTRDRVSDLYRRLSQEIYKSLRWQNSKSDTPLDKSACLDQAQTVTRLFLEALPDIRSYLKEDRTAMFMGDPAAGSEPEIILAYPGFAATTVYRIAHFLFNQGVPLIPRLMTEIAHSQTGVDIHPGATIGRFFCIDHGTGVVIGETTVIGDYVKLYQGVTLGALSVPKTKSKAKRHPTVEDYVTIYARTTILGGDTVIGHHSTIGGNVWLVESIPPHSKLYISSDFKQVLKPGLSQ